MEIFLAALQILTLLGVVIITVISKNYLPSYTKEKGKNLATKEDIKEITQKIEGVKTEYARGLESFKSEIWLNQQKITWKREEFHIKIDIFKKALETTNRLHNAIIEHQIYVSSREIALAAAESDMPISQEARDFYNKEYADYREKAATSYKTCRELSIETTTIAGQISIFFSEEVSNLLLAVRDAAKPAINHRISKPELRIIFNEKLIQTNDVGIATAEIGAMHEKKYFAPIKEMESFLRKIKESMDAEKLLAAK